MTDSSCAPGRSGTGTMLKRLTPPILDDHRRAASRDAGDGKPTGSCRVLDCGFRPSPETPAHKGFPDTARRLPTFLDRWSLSTRYSGPDPSVAASLAGRPGFGGLTQLESDDDTTFADGTIRQSQLSLTASAGQEYLIAVDSFGAATGDTRLSWTA